MDQRVTEVIHPHNRQPILRTVHVDIAFSLSYIKLASFSPIVAEEGELVESAKIMLSNEIRYIRQKPVEQPLIG